MVRPSGNSMISSSKGRVMMIHMCGPSYSVSTPITHDVSYTVLSTLMLHDCTIRMCNHRSMQLHSWTTTLSVFQSLICVHVGPMLLPPLMASVITGPCSCISTSNSTAHTKCFAYTSASRLYDPHDLFSHSCSCIGGT